MTSHHRSQTTLLSHTPDQFQNEELESKEMKVGSSAIGVIGNQANALSRTHSPSLSRQSSISAQESNEDDDSISLLSPESGLNTLVDEFNHIGVSSPNVKKKCNSLEINGKTNAMKDNSSQPIPKADPPTTLCDSSLREYTSGDDQSRKDECSKNITDISLTNDDLSVEPSIAPTAKAAPMNKDSTPSNMNASGLLEKKHNQTQSSDDTPTPIAKFNDGKHLEKFIEKQKEHYESLIEEQKDQHSAQIDEIIEQLNSIEQDYQYEISNLQMTINKKEILTEALTNSLSELKSQNYTLNDTVNKLEAQCSTFSTKLNSTHEEIENLRHEMNNLKHQHARELEEKEEQRVASITDAQNEIRMAAERQFGMAQKQYVQLKQDHSTVSSECEILRVKVSTLEQDNVTLERKYESEKAQLMSELAETRAGLATSQADAMKIKSVYGSKTAKLLDNEKELEMKLRSTEAECREAHALVGSVVREKEKLKIENVELQSLCEELMGIVEGEESRKGNSKVEGNESNPTLTHNTNTGSYEEVESL